MFRQAALAAGAAVRGGVLETLSSSRGYSSLTVETATAVRGSGGRHSISGIKATVFGATGFVGRYVVTQLGRIGSSVSMPTRCADTDRQHLRVMGDLGQMVFWDMPHDFIRKDDDVRKAIGDSNVVINLIGRDYETYRYHFEDVNIDVAQRIAKVSAELGVKRLVHFSALGAGPNAPSKQLRTKAAGEQAVLAAFPNATIIRPAPIIGSEDRLLRTVASLSTKLPFIPLFDGGKNKMAPVDVRDVAAAVKEVLLREDTAGQTLSLQGPDVFTWEQLVRMVFKVIREPERAYYVPQQLGVLAAKPREFLQAHVPFPVPVLPAPLYTSDNVLASSVDYVAPPGAPGFAELGLAPRKLEGITIDYLRAFRSGGYQLGADVLAHVNERNA